MKGVTLSSSDFIYPMFARTGENVSEEVPSMPGIFRFSTDLLTSEAKGVSELGIPALLLFGTPGKKDKEGSQSYSPEGAVQRAVTELKQSVPEMVVMTDVCLCSYTDHGHCGIVSGGEVDNDKTLTLLSKIAISHAEAGADMVAPSAMMDGQVRAIREGLDDSGFKGTGIMGYSAKFASAFYGPFRDAADSTPQFGDRRGYQMDPADAREALREIELDIEEGADIVMVKPALSYLDIIRQARDRFDLPMAAYNVSGEYAMIKAAARNGWIEEKRVMLEVLTSIKRAGADMIISYFAPEVARLAQKGEL